MQICFPLKKDYLACLEIGNCLVYCQLQKIRRKASDECMVENEIKVVFASKEQADGFKGMCFNRK